MQSDRRWVAALVRHGHYHQPPDVPSAHLPHPLTPRGRQHALDGAAELARWVVANGVSVAPVIHASCLLRAHETAHLLCGVLAETLGGSFEVRETESLMERSVGCAANLTQAEIAGVIEADPRHPPLPAGWKSDSHYRLPLPGAESLVQAGARVATHVERVHQDRGSAPGDVVQVFVGHGGSFRHAAAALGVLTLGEVAALSMHHGRPVLLERRDGPHPRWTHVGGHWKVRARPDDREAGGPARTEET